MTHAATGRLFLSRANRGLPCDPDGVTAVMPAHGHTNARPGSGRALLRGHTQHIL